MSGAYQLLLRLKRGRRIKVGKLGAFYLPAGWYVYTGSALKGLEARVRRHLSRPRSKRWHIDYLVECADSIVAFLYPSSRRLECELNLKTLSLPGAEVPILGFGSSDCRTCPAHLVRFRRRPPLPLRQFPSLRF
ncbi:MAG TPA: GIY-YIG nuclease family protein [Armatimonadetes bacterium]|nr:GIY-YIG nuclease family protein [Armatimonadota bacterium]